MNVLINVGNVYNGIQLKWSEPPEARMPSPGWRLYVFKGETQTDILHLHRQSAYLFGREDAIADVHLMHGSISKQHSVIQYRLKVVSGFILYEYIYVCMYIYICVYVCIYMCV